MEENKQMILDKLCETLQLTRMYCDLVSLKYVYDENSVYEEKVIAKFKYGGRVPPPLTLRVINVSGDSGIGMIEDVLKSIY